MKTAFVVSRCSNGGYTMELGAGRLTAITSGEPSRVQENDGPERALISVR